MFAVKGNNTGSFKDARELERKGELKAAVELYQKLHRRSPGNLKVVDRLIIVFRKLKNTVKEINFIDTAIKIHEQYYSTGKKAGKQTISISKKLNLLLGHTDKKGKALFKSDEVLELQLRKNRLEQKASLPAEK